MGGRPGRDGDGARIAPRPAQGLCRRDHLIPAGREGEYYGFYEISDKGTSWLGPLAFGLVYQLTASYRVGLVSLLIFLFALLAAPVFGARETRTYILVGVVWLVLTLAFELLFGHYVIGKSWAEIGHVLDPRTGNLFLVALSSALISPWLAARLRGLI